MKTPLIGTLIGGIVGVSIVVILVLILYLPPQQGDVLYYPQFQQQADAQEQHFQDCKARMSDQVTRLSQLIDRVASQGYSDLSGDLRAQYSGIMNEMAITRGDCSDVSDRLNADQGLWNQLSYLRQQMAQYGIPTGQ